MRVAKSRARGVRARLPRGRRVPSMGVSMGLYDDSIPTVCLCPVKSEIRATKPILDPAWGVGRKLGDPYAHRHERHRSVRGLHDVKSCHLASHAVHPRCGIGKHYLLLAQVRHPAFLPPALPPQIVIRGIHR